MRVQILASAALVMMVTACGDSEPAAQQQQQPRSIQVRSEAQNALHKLSPMNQKIALRRAIYDSGSACKTVSKAGYVQEYGNLSMWTASCASGRSFAIFVGPDGSAQVRDCREMEPLKLPACVIRKEAEEPAAG
jgi:hypothetical protein